MVASDAAMASRFINSARVAIFALRVSVKKYGMSASR